MITTLDLEKTVRELATDAPDNVYEKPDDFNTCCYSRGECTNGSVGCLIGQAMAKHGYDVSLLDFDGSLLASEACAYFNIIGRTIWLNEVQSSQDEGHEWLQAISYADRVLATAAV
jgi:hypothetical protein